MPDIRLVRTCAACPEQYDAFIGDRQVGYLRLRHGRFTVEYPDCGGEMLYQADTLGDGMFAASEYDHHMERARQAIAERVARGD